MTDKTPAPDQRARNRRLTLLLFLVAAGVYAVFIASTILHTKG
ncbi:MAG: hypothetical protein WCH32_00285 [Pseudomonadota bacterium]